MAAPGRSYNADNYRYGFNGKEKDKDITAGDLDFGARIYDGRIGRWLSVDPLQKKYPNWSPYSSAMNSPLKLKDVDGKDVGVTIVGNCITFSSTVFVTGPGASDMAEKANTAFNTLNKSALANRTYKHTDGKTYEVQFQVHYVAVDPSNSKDPNYAAYQETMKAVVGTSPNNVMSIEEKGSKNLMTYPGSSDRIRSKAGSSTNSGYNRITKLENTGVKSPYGVEQIRRIDEPIVANATGNLTYVYKEASGATAVHETFHLLGLGDRYLEEKIPYYYTSMRNGKMVTERISISTYHKGFKDDLMNNNSLNAFSQVHIDNLAKSAIDKTGGKEGTAVVGTMSDNANNRQNENADPNPYKGYSSTPPAQK